jgi:hypothetical protein
VRSPAEPLRPGPDRRARLWRPHGGRGVGRRHQRHRLDASSSHPGRCSVRRRGTRTALSLEENARLPEPMRGREPRRVRDVVVLGRMVRHAVSSARVHRWPDRSSCTVRGLSVATDGTNQRGHDRLDAEPRRRSAGLDDQIQRRTRDR